MHEQDMAGPEGRHSAPDRSAAGWLWEFWGMPAERREAIREAVVSSFSDSSAGHRAWLAGIAQMERTAGIAAEQVGSEVVADGQHACLCPQNVVYVSDDAEDGNDFDADVYSDRDDVEGWQL